LKTVKRNKARRPRKDQRETEGGRGREEETTLAVALVAFKIAATHSTAG